MLGVMIRKGSCTPAAGFSWIGDGYVHCSVIGGVHVSGTVTRSCKFSVSTTVVAIWNETVFLCKKNSEKHTKFEVFRCFSVSGKNVLTLNFPQTFILHFFIRNCVVTEWFLPVADFPANSCRGSVSTTVVAISNETHPDEKRNR